MPEQDERPSRRAATKRSASAPARVKRESIDRYLGAVHALAFPPGADVPEAGRPAALVRISERLGVSDAAAWEMLRRLDGAGYVRHDRKITLTQAGLEHAGRVLRARRVVSAFLVSVLDYSAADAHEESEAVASAATPRMVEMMHLRAGRPERDPDGWCVDVAAERIESHGLVALTDLPQDVAAVLRRVDRNAGGPIPASAEGALAPGTPVTRLCDDGEDVRVALGSGPPLVLPRRLAAAIHVPRED